MSGKPFRVFYGRTATSTGKQEQFLAIIRLIFVTLALIYLGFSFMFGHQNWFFTLRLTLWVIIALLAIPLIITMIFLSKR